MRYGRYPGMPGAHFGVFMIIPCIILTLILIILLVYLFNKLIRKNRLAVNNLGASNNSPLEVMDTTGKALEILNIRYANGEIPDEEYNIKKQHILSHIQ